MKWSSVCRKSIPAKIKRWYPTLGVNAPRYPTAPEPLESGVLMLEGERIELVGPMQGDHVHCTFVNVPSARTVIAGDLLFNQVHLWNGESLASARKAWLASLDRIAATGATRFVAGHKKPGLPDDLSALSFARGYLQKFEQVVSSSKGSKEIAAKMRAAYPDAIDFFGDFILGNSSQVAAGETPPWQE